MDEIEVSIKKIVNMLEIIPHNFDEVTQRTPYYNMAATLTDSVLQAGMNYSSVVYPRIYDILSRYADYCTTCDFIILFQTIPIEEIIHWKNKRKQSTICELAWFLYNEGINTEEDLAKWIAIDLNAERLLTINGIGYKTIDYLKLLSGEQAIPVDRHMLQFLELSNVIVHNYKEASKVLRKTAAYLKIGESTLDRIIWNYMSNNNVTKQITLFDVYGNYFE